MLKDRNLKEISSTLYTQSLQKMQKKFLVF